MAAAQHVEPRPQDGERGAAADLGRGERADDERVGADDLEPTGPDRAASEPAHEPDEEARAERDPAQGEADVPWLDVGLAVGGVALGAGLLVGVVSWLAGGAVGPGRLEVVGADALVVGALAAAEIGGGAALAILWARLDVLGRRHGDPLDGEG